MLSQKFPRAFELAFQLHREQVRKGSGIPYLAHLLSVTGLVFEAGGSEEEAIAALLHDAAEDQGGEATLTLIRTEFGSRVAELVAGLSDTFETPKPPWRDRKAAYLADLKTADESILRISLADKLHNSRAILTDHELFGTDIWDRFAGKRSGTVWYYTSLLKIYQSRSNLAMVREFARVVGKMQSLE